MKKSLMELVFILDRSGSMSGLESDTIGGYNSMFKKQKEKPGDVKVTTVLFDDQYEILHNRLDMEAINSITDKEYYVRGTTALLDAMGKTIKKMVSFQKRTAEKKQSKQVLFVIITDGMENASREYSYDQVKEMVDYQKEKYGWEFIFLGANIDAYETANRFGIHRDRAVNYHADAKGTHLNYEVLSETVMHMRVNESIDDSWKEKIEKDYEDRKLRD